MGQISEVQFSAEPETLMALSRLFTYPEQLPDGRHLAAWTPDFFGRVASWDTDGFYGDLAGMCQMIFSITGLWPLQTAAVPGYRRDL